MQENAYRIMENFVKMRGEEPTLSYMITELEILELGPRQQFTGQTAAQAFTPIEVTKVAGLNLYLTQTEDISTHKSYTQRGAGSHPQPAGTKYEHERQRNQSSNGSKGSNHQRPRSRDDNRIRYYKHNSRHNSYDKDRRGQYPTSSQQKN